ncbi:VOC family protein [Kitasatospora sp. NPDC088351]|uniref:VOC family protein n=1 Tax=Kitasatospora sp. NPDC088351 TaxID=3155180 RepID=UPI00344138DF
MTGSTASPSGLSGPPGLSERWFRTTPDSSVLDRPRLLARSLIDLADLDDRIAFYERLLGVRADLRMPIPDFGGLELAAVGTVLLIASERPFTPVQRRTAYSLIVPSLAGQLDLLGRTGTTVLEPREAIVPGARARVRYPDGSLAELVEHRPRPGERPAPRQVGPGDGGVRLLVRRAVPAASLGGAVRFYETALETASATAPETLSAAPGTAAATGAVPPAPGRAGGAGFAIVGNLLLVGSDEAAHEDASPVPFALLAPSVEAAAARAGAAIRPGSGVDGRPVVPLPGGESAEIWAGPPAAYRA